MIPLGKTLEETGDERTTTKSKYNNNKKKDNILPEMEKLQWNSINKKQHGLEKSKMRNRPPFPSLFFPLLNFDRKYFDDRYCDIF